jgi:hypothetical protein
LLNEAEYLKAFVLLIKHEIDAVVVDNFQLPSELIEVKQETLGPRRKRKYAV